MKKVALFLALSLFSFSISAEVLTYNSEGKEFEGFILKSKNKSAAAILIVHNWMGVTAETKTQADRFHKLGYTVMAADIFGKGVRPKDQKEAAAQSGQFKNDRTLYRKHLNLALETLKSQPGVEAKKIAVVGYCFGGLGALELARAGAEISGAISFHGSLDSQSPTGAKNVKTKILALHGADDPFVPAADIAAFETEMKTGKVSYELVKYPGAVHSFTEKSAGSDPKKGAAYNAKADTESFTAATAFLKKAFK